MTACLIQKGLELVNGVSVIRLYNTDIYTYGKHSLEKVKKNAYSSQVKSQHDIPSFAIKAEMRSLLLRAVSKDLDSSQKFN